MSSSIQGHRETQIPRPRRVCNPTGGIVSSISVCHPVQRQRAFNYAMKVKQTKKQTNSKLKKNEDKRHEERKRQLKKIKQKKRFLF